MIRYDSHSHSTGSHDGTHTPMEMARAALEQGLLGLAITDHCEFDEWKSAHYNTLTPLARRENIEAKSALAGRLDLSVGIEIGQQDADETAAGKTLEERAYDFVIGSVHRMAGWPDLYQMDYGAYDRRELDRLLHEYFDKLEGIVRWGNFDVLGHLTYLLRSAKKNSGVEIDIFRYRDRLEALFRLVVGAGKGIELNTSGLRGPLGKTMPSLRTLRLYRELGGEIITVGSDAHRREDLAAGFGQARALLLEAGFRYYAFYRQRRPSMYPLE